MITSPTDQEPQFQTWAPPSNLDRCYRCGMTRSAHGADWACPATRQRGLPPALLVIGAVLAVAGGGLWVLAGASGAAPQTAGAVGFLSGVTLIVAGLLLARRPR